MFLLHYIEIQNYKRFGERQRIELDSIASEIRKERTLLVAFIERAVPSGAVEIEA